MVARPLTALTRKDKNTGATVSFVCDSQCELVFQSVKSMLVSAPLLHPPDLNKLFFLWTDACSKEFGALLEQEGNDGRRYPIAYASRLTVLRQLLLKCNSLHITYYLQLNYLVTVTYYP